MEEEGGIRGEEIRARENAIKFPLSSWPPIDSFALNFRFTVEHHTVQFHFCFREIISYILNNIAISQI